MSKRDVAALSLDALRSGGKAALAAALARLESHPDDAATLDLLDAAYAAPQAHVVGITGPPGVGKSTLIGAAVGAWRRAGRSVAVIAVDPSSRRSGGALLGDRTRLRTDPEDQGVFVRSMAARDRLGGLAALTVSTMVLMRALYDVVLIETVGVGQSETDVVGVADTVVLCVQPNSGDSLQFMKAGIVEIPHVVIVTKGDLGAAAERAMHDVLAALAAADPDRGRGRNADCDGGRWRVPVFMLSAQQPDGVAQLLAAVEAHAAWLASDRRGETARQGQAEQWLEDAVRERFGREGLRRAGRLALPAGASPFRVLAATAARLLAG
ncbi:MAG TPA: methylmalonyl Co-A mutase-associated GTPase MeaB [Stellaceae bacterium]